MSQRLVFISQFLTDIFVQDFIYFFETDCIIIDYIRYDDRVGNISSYLSKELTESFMVEKLLVYVPFYSFKRIIRCVVERIVR